MTILKIAYPSANYDDRPSGADVEVLVLHYTGMKNCEEALSRLTDPHAEVSAHYLISEMGEIFSLVPEEKRAWHAGISYWRGIKNVNDYSIGIELENPGHQFGYRDFPASQINALFELSQEIISRHSISARNVVGHSDIAPRRKVDPGELFNWKLMARQGIGLWPTAEGQRVLPDNIEALLSFLGYEVCDIRATIRAFQRRYLPSKISGRVDIRTSETINALLDLIGGYDPKKKN